MVQDSTSYSSLVVYDMCFFSKKSVLPSKSTLIFGWPPFALAPRMAGLATSPDLKDEVEQLCSSWATARMRTISLERQLFLKTQEARKVVSFSLKKWGWMGRILEICLKNVRCLCLVDF